MNIVRVPFRVSLFGGGTDFRDFYSKKNSTIVSFSIDRYCYISLRKLLPYFNTKYRLSWSKIEEVSEINDLTHPSVKACLDYLKIQDPLNCSYKSLLYNDFLGLNLSNLYKIYQNNR